MSPKTWALFPSRGQERIRTRSAKRRRTRSYRMRPTRLVRAPTKMPQRPPPPSGRPRAPTAPAAATALPAQCGCHGRLQPASRAFRPPGPLQQEHAMLPRRPQRHGHNVFKPGVDNRRADTGKKGATEAFFEAVGAKLSQEYPPRSVSHHLAGKTWVIAGGGVGRPAHATPPELQEI